MCQIILLEECGICFSPYYGKITQQTVGIVDQVDNSQEKEEQEDHY